jgi:hypothetical protein
MISKNAGVVTDYFISEIKIVTLTVNAVAMPIMAILAII